MNRKTLIQDIQLQLFSRFLTLASVYYDAKEDSFQVILHEPEIYFTSAFDQFMAAYEEVLVDQRIFIGTNALRLESKVPRHGYDLFHDPAGCLGNNSAYEL